MKQSRITHSLFQRVVGSGVSSTVYTGISLPMRGPGSTTLLSSMPSYRLTKCKSLFWSGNLFFHWHQCVQSLRSVCLGIKESWNVCFLDNCFTLELTNIQKFETLHNQGLFNIWGHFKIWLSSRSVSLKNYQYRMGTEILSQITMIFK